MLLPSPSASLLFAVLEVKGTAGLYQWNTVAIAGLDGYARAKATFAPMPVPSLGCMGALIPTSAHVAAGRVFYADPQGVIRSLSSKGTITTVTRFPLTSTQQMLSFAVSPDGRHVLGAVFTAPKNAFSCDGSPTTGTFSFDAFTAASGEPATLVYHQSWTSAPTKVMAFTGWDATGPIGTYPTVWASQGGGPGSTLGVLARIDATTLKPLAVLNDPSKCLVWDSISTGAFVCTEDAVKTSTQTYDVTVSVRQADGTEMWHFIDSSSDGGTFNPYLAPDGQHVLVCCAEVASGFREVLVARNGGRANVGDGFSAQGWLDKTTMVGTFNTNPLKQPPFPLAYVRLGDPGSVVSMGFAGLFVGPVTT